MREFDLNDMLKQLTTIRPLGVLKEIMGFIPGLSFVVPRYKIERVDERRLRRFGAIVRAMTPEERRDPDLLDRSRIVRVAKGSGTSLHEVSDLLREYHKLRRTLRHER